jgi:hypothetical protein
MNWFLAPGCALTAARASNYLLDRLSLAASQRLSYSSHKVTWAIACLLNTLQIGICDTGECKCRLSMRTLQLRSLWSSPLIDLHVKEQMILVTDTPLRPHAHPRAHVHPPNWRLESWDLQGINQYITHASLYPTGVKFRTSICRCCPRSATAQI